MIKASRHKDLSVAVSAIQALNEIGEDLAAKDSIKRLIDLLFIDSYRTSSNFALHDEAFAAILNFKENDDVIAALEKVAIQNWASYNKRMSAIKSLGESKHPQAVDTLQTVGEKIEIDNVFLANSKLVAETLVDTLLKQKSDTSIRALEQIVYKTKNKEMAYLALAALGTEGGVLATSAFLKVADKFSSTDYRKKLMPNLTKLANSRNVEVSQPAKRILDKWTKPIEIESGMSFGEVVDMLGKPRDEGVSGAILLGTNSSDPRVTDGFFYFDKASELDYSIGFSQGKVVSVKTYPKKSR